MKNNITLIGSILAVALLLLVSLSNVVGYQSVKSDKKIDSPLFSIRNNRGDVSSDYIGKDELLNLIIPKKDKDLERINEFINFINKLDDSEFDRFVDVFIFYINKYNLNNIKASDKDIEIALYDLKNNPDILKYIDMKNPKTSETCYTCFIQCILTAREPLCSIYYMILIIAIPFVFIYVYITSMLFIAKLTIEFLCANNLLPTTQAG